MQALNEDTVRAVGAQGTRCDDLVWQGQSGKASWKKKAFGFPLDRGQMSFSYSCLPEGSQVEEALLSHLPVCTGAGYEHVVAGQ